jgi:hypothetical protein
MPAPRASTSHWRRFLAVLVSAFLLSPLAVASAAAEESAPVSYQGHAYTGAASPSEDKPQSKLWYQDGAWWAIMLSGPSNTINVFELMPDHTWRDTGTVVDTRPTSTGDALWEDGKLFVASRVSSGVLRVFRLSYAPTTRKYTMDSGFPVNAAGGGSESVTIARDSNKRLWITYTQSSEVWLAHSTTSDTAWTAPFTVPVDNPTVTSDDISAVIAIGAQPGVSGSVSKIGVMWSDQNTGAFRFAVHDDTAVDSKGLPTKTWQMETPLEAPDMGDDHINLKGIVGDDDGRIHAVVKTSQKSLDAPLQVVLTRSAAGQWSQAVAGRVRDNHTRGQIALDRENKMIYVLATSPTSGSSGVIYYKRSPLSAISFETGLGTPLMSWSGVRINNVSVGKDPVDSTTGLVAIGTDAGNRRYYHAEMSLASTADAQAPTAPTDLSATAASVSRVDLAWTASTDNVAVTGYDVFRDGVQVGSTAGATSYVDSTVAPGTGYTYTVRARDGAGNLSGLSAPVTVRTRK